MRRVRAKVSDQPTGFVWVVDKTLAGSGYPASKGQLMWLRNRGVGAVLSLTEEPLPKELVAGSGLVAGHVPMADHAPPDPTSLEKAVSFIEDQMRGSMAVDVHCLAGEGRTGCVLAAYLIKTEHMTADQALTYVRKMKPAFVESGQERAISEYASVHFR